MQAQPIDYPSLPGGIIFAFFVMNLVVNATSGLFGAAFGAATLEKEEGRR